MTRARPLIFMVGGFGSAAILISLDVAYKHKQLDADYGGYASTVIAFLVPIGILVGSLVNVYRSYQLERKLKIRH
jgi:hypothetical protein